MVILNSCHLHNFQFKLLKQAKIYFVHGLYIQIHFFSSNGMDSIMQAVLPWSASSWLTLSIA
jgi:hypothetical protein